MGIFPDGVGLVRPPPVLEWAESEARLARIDKSRFEATLQFVQENVLWPEEPLGYAV